MQFRRLEPKEHGKTRALYEEVFQEDAPSFVDYYYTWKTKDNTIFAAYDEKGIHGMVHLNPFQIYDHGVIHSMHYIVAVATQKAYRHQGIMRRLLEMAEYYLAEQGECFTFLMPAKKEIYLPFGYQFFYAQKRGKMTACRGQLSEEYELREIRAEEFQKTADRINEILLQQYDLFVWRDASYYERLLAEQQCEAGTVMLLVQKQADGTEQIQGSFCVNREENETEALTEIRELVLAPEISGQLFQEQLSILTEDPEESSDSAEMDCVVAGCSEQLSLQESELVPLMMGKVLNTEASGWERYANARVFLNEVV